MKILLAMVLTCFTLNAIAQPPLSKKLQKEKEEFEALIAAEKKYEELMKEADIAFKNKNYVDARMTYEEAIQYNQDKEQWLLSKVNDLDILMAKNAARQVDSIVLSMPSRSVEMAEPDDDSPKIENRAMASNKPKVSVESPEEDQQDETLESDATGVKTEESDNKPRESKPSEVDDKSNRSSTEPKKVKEDFTKYEDGITEETFTLENHVVDRIVVKEGIDVIVFKKVKHNWGGEFYFLDGVGTTQRYWMDQVEKYRKKYGPSDK